MNKPSNQTFKTESEVSDEVKRACAAHNYKWPKELSSGVMFFDGQRITIDEFNKWARKFK